MLFKHRPKDDGGGGEAFSTLEANESRNEHLVSWPLSVDSDKQVVIYDETQAACFEGLEVVGKYQTVGHAIWPLWRKLFFFTGLTAVITTAAVLAGVFGSRRSHAKSSSPALNSATGFNITFPLDAVVSPRNIAAVSYTLQSTNNTSLYFQDNEGQLWEAANNGSSWSNRELGFTVANGSALAAAVSNPSYPFAINAYYLDSENIIHDILYNPSNNSWGQGTLSNQAYKALPNSSLTALLHQCSLCANNTVIAFQDEGGNVQIGNETEAGWSLTQLNLDHVIGTGLALQPYYVEGAQDQINLYSQKSDLNLSLTIWRPDSGGNEENGWSPNFMELHPVPEGSPIAAASSFSSLSTGSNTWIKVLSLSNTGIEVDTWSGGTNTWLQNSSRPSTMSNSTSEGSFRSIAVTALGRAFAVESTPGKENVIQSWQLEDNVDWKEAGNVDIGSV